MEKIKEKINNRGLTMGEVEQLCREYPAVCFVSCELSFTPELKTTKNNIPWTRAWVKTIETNEKMCVKIFGESAKEFVDNFQRGDQLSIIGSFSLSKWIGQNKEGNSSIDIVPFQISQVGKTQKETTCNNKVVFCYNQQEQNFKGSKGE